MRSFEALVDALEAACPQIHGIMLSQVDSPVWEAHWNPFDGTRRHLLFSLTKSFTAIAAMFAVQEGRFGLDDRIVDAFPDKVGQNPSEHLRAMRLRDLLSMATGHETEPLVWNQPEDWAAEFFAHPVPHVPGSHFLYNTPASYMVAHWLGRVTGEDLVDYLRPRLFDPLGIEGNDWMRAPGGVRSGGFGLSLRLEEVHRFGRFLQRLGEGCMDPELIRQATQKQVSNGSERANDWQQGYGFQFWQCREGAYRGDGAYGQFMVVQPATGWVVSIFSGTSDMQAVLDVLWELLPGLPTPETAVTLRREFPGPATGPIQPIARAVSFPENELGLLRASVAVESPESGEATLALELDGDRFTLPVAVWTDLGDWSRWSLVTGDDFAVRPTRVFGKWGPDGTGIRLRLAYVESPFAPTLSFQPRDEGLELEFHGPLWWFHDESHAPVFGV